MAMNVGQGSGVKAQMNSTPMIDVLLVLIIIFMLLTPVSTGEKAEIPQPSNTATDVHPEEVVVIEVFPGAAGEPATVKINQQQVSWDELGAKLNQIFSKRIEKTAFVRGEKSLDFETVADVIDIAHSAGVKRIGLMTPDTERRSNAQRNP